MALNMADQDPQVASGAAVLSSIGTSNGPGARPAPPSEPSDAVLSAPSSLATPIPPRVVSVPRASVSNAIEETVTELPEVTVELDSAMLEFIFSSRYQASLDTVKRLYNFNDQDTVFISDLDRLVMAGQLDLEGYLVALEDRFAASLSQAQRDKLYAQLLAERFVPLGDKLSPSAIEVARTEGLTLPPTPHFQLYFKPLTYSGAATEVASMAGFSTLGGPIRERLRELLISKLKGIRTDAQVVEMLGRGLDFGGLGLDKRMADQALLAMNDILKRAKLLSEDEYANWLADEARKNAAPAPVASSASSSVPLTEEDQEIARIQSRMPQPLIDLSSTLAQAVETTLQRLSYRPTDDYLARRLRNVISSRLRDVRSALELKQLLMRDIKVGGVGLSSTEAEQVAKQIEAAYQEFRTPIAHEEKTKIEQQLEEQKKKVEERRRQEAEEHAKWFEEKIRARKAGEMEKNEAIQGMRRSLSVASLASPIDIKEKQAETAKFGPLIPASSSVNPFPQPQTAGVKVSPATFELAQTTSASRPRMDGVTYAGPQLVGLVGELKSLTVPEFRRLSRQPQEAAKKIQQKIETLAQESFEKRIEGIRALQGSPLQEAYMALVGESFRTAKPVGVLAEEKRAAGQDSLSSDEIGAIIQLNSALHF